MKFRFSKEERIYRKNDMQFLLKEGKSFLVHPFKVVYCLRSCETATSYPLKSAISIPKRKFKKAVDRNLLKRRSKEALRLHRNPLKQCLQEEKKELLVLLVFISNNKYSYSLIKDKIILILQRLQQINAEADK
jgi:ribonuclease P protein component